MIRKIINHVKEYIIKDWSDIIDSDLYDAFILKSSYSLAIPIAYKGILAGVTEDRVRKFTEAYNTSWHPKEPLGNLTPTIISSPDIFNNDTLEYYNGPVYIVLDPDELDIEKFTSSLFDGKICSQMFAPTHTIYMIEGFPLAKIKIDNRYKRSAKALRFIFLYDKKTEKVAKALVRLINDIYADS